MSLVWVAGRLQCGTLERKGVMLVATVRAAVVQAASVAFDREKSLEKLASLTRTAAQEGAELVVFPEAFVSGYPRGLSFGATVGSRSSAGREEYRRYWDSSIDVPGSDCDRIGALAARYGVHLVVGVVEGAIGTLYCSVLFFGPGGELLGKHRKVMPTGAERLVWGYGDGSTMPVFETPIGRLGAVICWENYMPLLRMNMYSKGIQLYCAPTADARDTWIASMGHIACEGRCFVLSCNQFARRSDYPEDYGGALADEPPTAIVCRGGSCIIGPLGQLLAGPNFEAECVLTAELDLSDIPGAKYDFDVVGHYSRPDIFRLHVNEQPLSPVVQTPGEAEEDAGQTRRVQQLPDKLTNADA